MIKFTFRRPAKVHGVNIDRTMGLNAWAAFAGSDENALVDGDFAASELRMALKSLPEPGIKIVAIHSHLTGDEPRIISSILGWGPAQSLAQRIQKARRLRELEYRQKLARM